MKCRDSNENVFILYNAATSTSAACDKNLPAGILFNRVRYEGTARTVCCTHKRKNNFVLLLVTFWVHSEYEFPKTRKCFFVFDNSYFASPIRNGLSHTVI